MGEITFELYCHASLLQSHNLLAFGEGHSRGKKKGTFITSGVIHI